MRYQLEYRVSAEEKGGDLFPGTRHVRNQSRSREMLALLSQLSLLLVSCGVWESGTKLNLACGRA